MFVCREIYLLKYKYLYVIKYMACNLYFVVCILFSFEMYFVTKKYIFQRNLFGQDDPVPPPHLQFFLSSDFGSSHDPAGLGLGEVPPISPVTTLLVQATQCRGHDNGRSRDMPANSSVGKRAS